MSELSFAHIGLKRCLLSGDRTAVPSDEDLRSKRSSTVLAGPGKFGNYGNWKCTCTLYLITIGHEKDKNEIAINHGHNTKAFKWLFISRYHWLSWEIARKKLYLSHAWIDCFAVSLRTAKLISIGDYIKLIKNNWILIKFLSFWSSNYWNTLQIGHFSNDDDRIQIQIGWPDPIC